MSPLGSIRSCRGSIISTDLLADHSPGKEWEIKKKSELPLDPIKTNKKSEPPLDPIKTNKKSESSLDPRSDSDFAGGGT